jgi:hypothetical protein
MAEAMKTCSRCGQQPLSAFSSDPSKKDGLHTRCKACRRQTEAKGPRRDTRTPAQVAQDEAIEAAKNRLTELFPTAYVKLVRSEQLRRELVAS